ncbi:MAG: hypothetical protein IJ565_03675 [Bacilli bacterium]|nr:hypothetical protein [Bacilli bacterium]
MVLASFGHFILSGIRVLFSAFDNVIYWLLIQVYNLMTDIARVNIFGSDGVGSFGQRIYTIIGVIMLFKLSFSIVQYIIEPDKMTDSKNGFGGIIKNVVIMFVMILVVPIVFRYAMALQYLILEDDTIGRLITGNSGGDYSVATNSDKSTVGDKIATQILSGFIRPDSSYSGCDSVTYSEECKRSLEADGQDTAANAYYNAYQSTGGYTYLTKMARIPDTTNGDTFVVTYIFGISSLVGGFVAYVLLMFCIDIATRTIKLAFLQLIAPIPIVSYIDDKGQGMFKKWLNTCTSTYLDLFVRLAGIDFAIYIITEFIMNRDVKICSWSFSGDALSTTNCKEPGIFVVIFLILGTLMFAKELPKIIEDITGLKLSGKFNLNPMKQLSSVPIAGAALGAGIGAVDAAMNGGNAWEGLKHGFSSVGLGGNAKKLSDLAPMHADMLKRRTEGRNELRKMDQQWKRGDRAGIDNIKALDGKNRSAYDKVGYKHNDFINSLMNADNEGERNKNFQAALTQAQAMGQAFKGVKVNGKTYTSIADLQRATETSTKTLKGLEATHESMRKTYADDARLEDSIKTRKYNETGNPTVTNVINAAPDDKPVFEMLSDAEVGMNHSDVIIPSTSQGASNYSDDEILQMMSDAQNSVSSNAPRNNNSNSNDPRTPFDPGRMDG